MKVIFKTNLFIQFSHFQTQRLKSYSWFIFPVFDSNLIQTTSNKEPERVYTLRYSFTNRSGRDVRCGKEVVIRVNGWFFFPSVPLSNCDAATASFHPLHRMPRDHKHRTPAVGLSFHARPTHGVSHRPALTQKGGEKSRQNAASTPPLVPRPAQKHAALCKIPPSEHKSMQPTPPLCHVRHKSMRSYAKSLPPGKKMAAITRTHCTSQAA
jgi:hypothetical protein